MKPSHVVSWQPSHKDAECIKDEHTSCYSVLWHIVGLHVASTWFMVEYENYPGHVKAEHVQVFAS